MKHLLLTLAASAVLSATALADVKDGETYKTNRKGGNSSVSVHIKSKPTMATVEIHVSDDSGASSPVDGTPGTAKNSCADSPEMSTPDGTTYQVKDGKMQRKNSAGKWINMGPPRKKARRGDPHTFYPQPLSPVSAGDDIGTSPLLAPKRKREPLLAQ